MEGAGAAAAVRLSLEDDDTDSRETLREIVEPQGFHALLAASGEEALDIVRASAVHLILLDMHMPRLTGLEAFAVIRQTLDRILPAVLMTADANNDLIRQAFAAQVYSVIPKPVSFNVMFHTLERALRKAYGALQEEKAPEKPGEPKPLPPAVA